MKNSTLSTLSFIFIFISVLKLSPGDLWFYKLFKRDVQLYSHESSDLMPGILLKRKYLKALILMNEMSAGLGDKFET